MGSINEIQYLINSIKQVLEKKMMVLFENKSSRVVIEVDGYILVMI